MCGFGARYDLSRDLCAFRSSHGMTCVMLWMNGLMVIRSV